MTSRAINVINQSDIWINGFDFIHKDNTDDLQISVVYHTAVFCLMPLPCHWFSACKLLIVSRLILVAKYEMRTLCICRVFPHGTNWGLFMAVIYEAYEHSKNFSSTLTFLLCMTWQFVVHSISALHLLVNINDLF